MRSCSHHISAWLSESDYRHLKKLMDASGLTTSNIIRKLLEGVEVTPRPTEHTIALLRELSAIGNNINQIAHTANATQSVSTAQLNEVQRLLGEAWRMVKDAY
ncbi:plasmid mobilization relaxosome protein MobC [Clostridiaceae bacterium]|nr:plasmid mobilization relaxosome protein MobC [Clostridiaceae bacterium]